MSVLGKFVLLLGLAIAGYGAMHLWRTLQAQRTSPVPDVSVAIVPEPADRAATVAAQSWPAVFGVMQADAPPPVVEAPISDDYALVGVVAGMESRWAVIAAPSGEVLVRPGDTLSGGETVEEITPGGVWITKGSSRARIGFPGDEDKTAPAIAKAATLSPQRVEIARSLFTGRDPRRVFGRAGTIQMIRIDGALVPEILWVRAGEIYDLIGLRAGDRVVRINGAPAGDPQTLRDGAVILETSTEVLVEIQRAGVIVPITVLFNDKA